jgi:cytidylate kinase
MHNENPVEKFGSYVVSQGKDPLGHPISAGWHSLAPAITISYQVGVDVSEISEKLAKILQNSELEHGQTWSVLNQQLIEAALEEQRWPKELAEAMPEEKRLFIDELMDDLCGLRPPSWVLVPQLVKTTLHLAVKGHVILIGHGATIITARMWNVFHVRLNGSLPKRIERVQTQRNLTPEAAAKLVLKEDRGRERYLRTHFHARLDNELLYDMAINTDRVSNDNAAATVYEGARRFFSEIQRDKNVNSYRSKDSYR